MSTEEKQRIKRQKADGHARDTSAGCTERVCSLLKECKGVCSILEELDDSQRKTVLELEKAEEDKLVPFGASIENQSINEVLKRAVVLLITTNEKFEYREPTIILKADDEVVGEEISDPAKAEEIRGKPGYLFTGKNDRPFVIYTHKLRGRKGVQIKFVTLPFSLPHDGFRKGLKNVDGISDLTCGWPSRSADLYLKQTFNLPTDDLQLGTLLIGFNIVASSKKVNNDKA